MKSVKHYMQSITALTTERKWHIHEYFVKCDIQRNFHKPSQINITNNYLIRPATYQTIWVLSIINLFPEKIPLPFYSYTLNSFMATITYKMLIIPLERGKDDGI